MVAHDAGYRLLFAHPRMVEDLLRGFVAEPWVDDLEFSTLERVNASYVSQHLAVRPEGDLVWRVTTRGAGAVPVYLLLEFQSAVDRYMTVRAMAYVALFYQDLISREELAAGGALPPTCAVVLYNGKARWRAADRLSDLIAEGPGSLGRFRCRLRYLLVDEQRCPPETLARPDNLVAALFRLEHSRGRAEVVQEIGRLAGILADEADASLRRSFVTWLRRVLLPGHDHDPDLPEVLELEEIRAMLEQTVLQWNEELREEGKRQGREEGRREGRREGEAALLLRQLERKFGRLDAAVRARVQGAGAEQLLAWGERFVTAERLDEVFGAS